MAHVVASAGGTHITKRERICDSLHNIMAQLSHTFITTLGKDQHLVIITVTLCEVHTDSIGNSISHIHSSHLGSFDHVSFCKSTECSLPFYSTVKRDLSDSNRHCTANCLHTVSTVVGQDRLFELTTLVLLYLRSETCCTRKL